MTGRPRRIDQPDDSSCLRACAAMLTGTALTDWPEYVSNTREFWRRWSTAFHERGIEPALYGYHYYEAIQREGILPEHQPVYVGPFIVLERGRWIALHRQPCGATHAVVMSGRRVYHDPWPQTRIRKRRQLDLIGALELRELS